MDIAINILRLKDYSANQLFVDLKEYDLNVFMSVFASLIKQKLSTFPTKDLI